jgi:hypothetical protein
MMVCELSKEGKPGDSCQLILSGFEGLLPLPGLHGSKRRVWLLLDRDPGL